MVLTAAAALCPAATPEALLGRLIVRQKISVNASGLETVLDRHGARLLRQMRSRMAVVGVPESSADAVVDSLRRSGLFEFVERDRQARIAAVPNDPLYASEWYLTKIQAAAAWDVTHGSPAITVAVLDTGVDATHPDLQGRVVAGWNFVTGTGATTDKNGHGTAAAGVIAAAANNGAGMAGLMWEGKIMPVVVLDAEGSGWYADMIAGIQYAADHGARVINMSLGGDFPSLALQSAIDDAWEKGVAVIASAGNNGTPAPVYPAACDHAVAVAATDEHDGRPPFSSFGSWLAISAPGTDILSVNIGGGYAYWWGTSFAAPVVSGVAALALSANPSLTAETLVRLLEQNADDIGDPGFDDQFGWGRVNAFRTVVAATSRTAADFDSNGTADLVWQNDSTGQVTLHYYGGAGGAVFQGWQWLNSAGIQGWHVVATADFNSDGVPDLVWENDATRQVTVHYYGGAGGGTFQGWAWLNASGVPGWHVAAAADFNGDKVPDLVWQNDATRQVTVHYYGGAGGAVFRGWAWLNAAGAPGWHVAAAADFNGNAVPDLVWQNDSTRQVTVHYYGGSGGAAYQGFNWLNASGVPGWHLAGTADFNMDGAPDLIWQNDSSRAVTVHYYGGAGGAAYQGWNWLDSSSNAGWHVAPM